MENHPRSEDVREVLAGEHAHLEGLFAALVAGSRCEEPGALRARWAQFEEELTAHLALEETQILPAFAREYPEEARGILEEHRRIRTMLEELGVDLELNSLRAERVAAFIGDLRAHAQREENLLYSWAGRRAQTGALAVLRGILSGRSPRRPVQDAGGDPQGPGQATS
jgi:hemerythrin superfamily protein